MLAASSHSFSRVAVRALAVLCVVLGLSLLAAVSVGAAPPGGQIAFVREDYSQGPDASRDEIWLMNSDGSQAHRIVGYLGAVADLEWSPDGRQLAFLARLPGEPARLWLCAADGADLREVPVTLPGTAVTENGLGGLAWSPAGTRLALSYWTWANWPRSRILGVTVVAGVTRTLVGSKAGYAFSGLTWAPKGTSLVVSAGSGTGESGRLLRYDAATGASRGVLGRVAYFEFWNWPDYSPDGKRIACSVSNIAAIVTGKGKPWFSIVTMPPKAGASFTTLIRSKTYRFATPSWSPNGRWLVASRRTENGQYRMVLVRAVAGGAVVDTGVNGWRGVWRAVPKP